MNATEGNETICSRGHKFLKTPECPVCPRCWPGYYFSDEVAAPALRALLDADIFNLEQLAKYSEPDISKLRGMGPSTIPILRAAMKKEGLGFRDEK